MSHPVWQGKYIVDDEWLAFARVGFPVQDLGWLPAKSDHRVRRRDRSCRSDCGRVVEYRHCSGGGTHPDGAIVTRGDRVVSQGFCSMYSLFVCMGCKELRHDRHTVTLSTDHAVFSPDYRWKILADVVVFALDGMSGTYKIRRSRIRKRYVSALDLSPGFSDFGVSFHKVRSAIK